MDKTRSPSLLNLAVTAVVVFVGLFYLIVALNTEDSLWFLSTFDEVPEEIVVNCYGQVSTLLPEDGRFDGLVEVVNATLSTSKNWDPLTMSDDTYHYYFTSDAVMVLELVYTPKVRIHSVYKFFSNLDSLIIPLDGRHSNTNAIFGRSNDQLTAGSLHYLAMPDVRTHVEAVGICTPR